MKKNRMFFYFDENKTLLFRKRRIYDEKGGKDDIHEGSIDGRINGRFKKNIKGLRRVPYFLPRLLNARAKEPDIWILIQEGETDVEAACLLGYVSTCSSFGAGSWPDEFNQYFEDANVCIFGDLDKAGERQKRVLPQKLNGVAKNIKVIDLPGPQKKGSDFKDWLLMGLSEEESKKVYEDGCDPWVKDFLKKKRQDLDIIIENTKIWEPPPPSSPSSVSSKKYPKERGADLESTVRTLLGRINLEGLIQELGGKPRGSSFFCPLHSHQFKTPSMYIRECNGVEKWFCANCDEIPDVGSIAKNGHYYGDAIDMWRIARGMSFIDAVRDLCDRYGVEMPKNTGKKNNVVYFPSQKKPPSKMYNNKSKEAKEEIMRQEENHEPISFYDMEIEERIAISQARMEKEGIHPPSGFFTFWPTYNGMMGTVKITYNPKTEQEKAVAICNSPLWISGTAKNVDGYLSGYVLEWEDLHRKRHWKIVKKSEIDPRGKELNEWRDLGIDMIPSKKQDLCTYLCSFNPNRPEDTILYVENSFSRDIEGTWSIAMPHALFENKKPPLLMTKGGKSIQKEKEDRACIWKPTLSKDWWKPYDFPHVMDAMTQGVKWQERKKAVQNLTYYGDLSSIDPMLCKGVAVKITAIATALFAMVRPITQWDGFGIHLWGDSTTGKSSIMQLASSMVGASLRPGNPGNYILGWETTVNGLPSLAVERFGLPLCLDELTKDMDKRVAMALGNFVYQLTSGSGKIRSSQTGKLADKQEFQVTLLSTGEHSFVNVMKEAGAKVKEGQQVRMLEFNIERGYLLGAEESDDIDKTSKSLWGFEAFFLMQAITKDKDAFVSRLVEGKKRCLDWLIKEISPEHNAHKRILKHFAGMASLLEICNQEGIFGWPVGYALEALLHAANIVLSIEHLTEDARMLSGLRENIIEYEHLHIAKVNTDLAQYYIEKEPKLSCLGFSFQKEGVETIALTENALSLWTSGMDAKTVAKKLESKKILITKGGRRKSSLSVDSKRMWLYFLDRDALFPSDEESTKKTSPF